MNRWLRFEAEEEVLSFAYGAMDEEGLIAEGWQFILGDSLPKNTLGDCDYLRKTIRLKRSYALQRRIAHVQRTILHEIAHALTDRQIDTQRKRDPMYQALELIIYQDHTADAAAAKHNLDWAAFREFLLEPKRRHLIAKPHGIEWARNAVRLGVTPDEDCSNVRTLRSAYQEYRASLAAQVSSVEA